MKKRLLIFCTLSITLAAMGQVDLSVESGGTMYISKAAYVYVSNTGDVNINASGNLIMDSDSDQFAQLYVDGTSTGDAIYRRWVAPASTTRDLVAPPVSGQAIEDFILANGTSGSDVLAAGTQVPGEYLFGTYDPDSTTGAYNEYSTGDTSFTISRATGFRAGTKGAGATLEFKGEIITDNPGKIIKKSTVTNARFPESNLIGNPYTTYILASNVVGELTSSGAIDASYIYIYAYDGSVTGTDGSTWNLINSFSLMSGDVMIAPGQAFLVYADDDEGTNANERVRFDPSWRTIGSGDDFLSGRNSSNNPLNTNLVGTFNLTINKTSNPSNTYSSALHFLDNNVSRGLDPSWDAGLFSMPSMSIATHLAEDSTGLPFTMQCLDGNDLTDISSNLTIPVHVRAQAGTQFTISITETDLPSGATIYLHDTENNSFTLLNDNDYVFTPSTTLNGIGRFYLRMTSSALSVDDYNFNSLNITSILNSKQIKVEGVLTADSDLNLYDVTGRLINTFELKSDSISTERYINVSECSEGIYIAEISNNQNQTKSKKIFIN